MHQLRTAGLAALSLLAAGTAAQAQPVTGLYLGAGIGWNFLQDANAGLSPGQTAALRADIPGANGRGKLEGDDGYVGVISLGWGFGNGLRAEAEANFRQNDVESVKGFGAANFGGVGGRRRNWGLMVNALYDIDFGWGVVPYVGGGVGWLRGQVDGVRATGAGGTRVFIDDETDSFAYQAIAGVGVPLDNWAPGLALSVEYRYLGTDEQGFDGRIIRTNGAVQRGSVDLENRNHSILVGLRYAFNPPRPPAPVVAPAPLPATAPAPARTYLVFFDFDRADLSDRARQIIADAAQTSRSTQTTRIEVAGHADRSGTPQYNQRLSQRRAEAVAGELVRLGVPRDAIAVQAFGESRPLVPTADGVREPQNRRVEIILR